MPLLAASPAEPAAGALASVIPAQPGLVVHVAGPGGMADCPVVAWAQVADDQAPGGSRLDPLFLGVGRTWTPDQFRAAYGGSATFTIAAQ